MVETVLIHARMAESTIENGFVWIKDHQIVQIGAMSECPSLEPADEIINCSKAAWVLPGMIDVHIHGAGGSDVMDATPEALQTMASLLPKEGTTSFLATTLTAPKKAIEDALENVKDFIAAKNGNGQSEIVGIHLEGPFINQHMKGAQPEADIIKPDVALFKKWQRHSNDAIKLVTLAPELDQNFILIRHLAETGVVVSMGHTNASYKEVQQAVDKGLSHVTHLYNGMSGIHHREPGAAGAALLIKELTAELIADGIHVHPEMLKLALRLKGAGQIILITDSMRAKCLKNGTYELGGQEVEVENGQAVLAGGSLAGSVLKLSQGRKNMQRWTGASINELVAMTSINPAKELGIFNRKGSITEGKDADLILIDEFGDILLTMCRGKIAFQVQD